MNVQWKKLLITALLWFVSEMLLTFTGLDDLADYSDFIAQIQDQYLESIHQYATVYKTLKFRRINP